MYEYFTIETMDGYFEECYLVETPLFVNKSGLHTSMDFGDTKIDAPIFGFSPERNRKTKELNLISITW